MPAQQDKIDDLERYMRPASVVMDLGRLGTLYPYPLSFMRSLTRRILREQWDIRRTHVDICENGYGDVVYEVQTPNALFSYVIFAKHLAAADRVDRVIAEDWNMTVTLCAGQVDDARLDRLRANVPLQEKGRVDSTCIVLSRANKSTRNYNYVVDLLAKGEQPDLDVMARVGYLYRTTAVYGSGKFGMADWDKVCRHYPDFARPFSAEMFSCFLVRDFSLFQADHVAKHRSSDTAVPMRDDIRRYVGIGNATGLGMAPYLINHPLLIDNWINVRETALARVKRDGRITPDSYGDFDCLAQKAMQHLTEITTDNAEQNVVNARLRKDLAECLEWFKTNMEATKWTELTDHAEAHFSHGVQELLHAVLLELYPEFMDDLEARLDVTEKYEFIPHMPLRELMDIIEDRYDWALDIDFDDEPSWATFWYSSEEKKEPRLGKRFEEPGAEKEMFLGMAYAIYDAHRDMKAFGGDTSAAQFALQYPKHRYTLRRIQTMSKKWYGEIRVNVLDVDVMPIHLLRCKLSFFGVGKFDPLSRLWVRNTMFQGAPILSDIGQTTADTWCFPIKPKLDDSHDRPA